MSRVLTSRVPMARVLAPRVSRPARALLLLVALLLTAAGCASTPPAGDVVEPRPVPTDGITETEAPSEPEVSEGPEGEVAEGEVAEADTAEAEAATIEAEVSGEPGVAEPGVDASSGAADSSPADSSDRRPGAVDPDRQPHGGVSSIEQVDFENGVAYWTGISREEAVVVSGGEFVRPNPDGPSELAFFIDDVVYGDLTGDGLPEAVVSTTVNTGGTGFFDSIEVFTIDGDDIVRLTTEAFGDRAFGGLARVHVDDGLVVAHVFGGDAACCPDRVTAITYVLAGNRIVPVHTATPLAYADSNSDEVRFLPGTSSAELGVWALDVARHFVFDAAASQQVRVEVLAGPFPDKLELRSDDGEVARDADSASEWTLTTTGAHRLIVDFGESPDRIRNTTLRITIGSGDGGSVEPGLDVRTIDVLDEPPVWVAAGLPVFGLPVIDAQIDDWFDSEVGPWIGWASERSANLADSSGGSYELSHTTVFANDELVSVRFGWFEYLCCQPYPNYGYRALVVDLSDERLVDIGEIIDLNRRGEVDALVTDALIEQEDFVDATLVPRWTSLWIVEDGIAFGTDRQGALFAMETTLSWDVLGDLVRPGVQDRVG